MKQDRRSLRALAALLPSGVLGLSMTLAAADASAATSTGIAPAKGTPESVALRLEAIRNSVSVVVAVPAAEGGGLFGAFLHLHKERVRRSLRDQPDHRFLVALGGTGDEPGEGQGEQAPRGQTEQGRSTHRQRNQHAFGI